MGDTVTSKVRDMYVFEAAKQQNRFQLYSYWRPMAWSSVCDRHGLSGSEALRHGIGTKGPWEFHSTQSDLYLFLFFLLDFCNDLSIPVVEPSGPAHCNY